MNKFNKDEAERVLRTAGNTIKIVEAVREGLAANEIVQKIGCNYSVAKYYIKLFTGKR